VLDWFHSLPSPINGLRPAAKNEFPHASDFISAVFSTVIVFHRAKLLENRVFFKTYDEFITFPSVIMKKKNFKFENVVLQITYIRFCLK